MSHYRPGPDRTRPPEQRNRPPPYNFQGQSSGRGHGDRHTNGADSYRPGDFSFQANGPHGRPPPRFPQAPTAPRGDRSNRNQRRNGPSRPLSNRVNTSGPRRNDNGPRTRANQGPRFTRRPDTSSRPLLRSERAPTPEQLAGMKGDASKFKSLNDLSDSDDEAMQLDSDENVSNDADSGDMERPQKRARLASSSQVVDEIEHAPAPAALPKWSNPDPYTSLPPPDQPHEKRKDFVKLIRKAKQSAEDSKQAAAETDDFISFDFEDVKEKPTKAPGSIKFSQRKDVASETKAVNALGPPPAPSKEVQEALEGRITWPRASIKQDVPESVDVWPPPASKQDSKKRTRPAKRTHDELDDDDSSQSRLFRRLKLEPGRPLPAPVLKEWRGVGKATPWLQTEHSNCETQGLQLHKEICDFYEYVRPQHFEKAARQDLVQRLQDYISSRWPGSEVHVFGSFAADLYLPNGDMDLVVISASNQSSARPPLGTGKSALFKFAKGLVNNRVAKPGSIAVIAKARVPLVKYVDSMTEIRCDVSFNNDTGVVANQTYKDWVAQYPALPVLLPLIKQFLMMRGLNDVATGGLGSFSVTCLLVNLMNQMPHVASGNMNPMQNLGEIFMHFLDYYGNKFNIGFTGINMNTLTLFPLPGTQFQRQGQPRLCIVDPNKPDNNVSSGSHQISNVMKSFSSAFTVLHNRIDYLRRRRVESSPDHNEIDDYGGSILGPLYAGNYYSHFHRQREKLRKLYEENLARYESSSQVPTT